MPPCNVPLQCPLFLPVITPDPMMNVQNIYFSFSVFLRKEVESLRLGFSVRSSFIFCIGKPF